MFNKKVSVLVCRDEKVSDRVGFYMASVQGLHCLSEELLTAPEGKD